MSAVGNVSRSTHHAVVSLAANYLSQSGFGVEPRPYHERISDTLADVGIDGDIRGLENVFVNVTSRLTHRLDKDLDRARVGADIAGRDVAVVLQWRGDRGIDQAYVVTSLADFTRLLGGTPPS